MQPHDDTDRRETILRVACTLLQQQGYHRTTMDHIAHHAGMSKKTLYLFFPSKRALVEQLLLTELFVPLTPSSTPKAGLEEQLRAMIFQMAEILLCEKRLGLLRTIIGETNRSPSIQQLMTELFHTADSKTNIQNWLDEQKKAGLLQFENAADTADHLFGLTIGAPMICRLVHCGPARDRDGLRRYLEEGLRIFLHGCRTPPT